MDEPRALPSIDRLKKVMTALLAVPKSAVEEAEAKRVRKVSRKRKRASSN
jgi:hypothetical protein